MNRREILMQYRETEQDIARLERELEEWRSRAEWATASYSLAPGCGDERHLENMVLHLHKLTLELAALVREQAERRRLVGRIIEAFSDSRLREVLRLRYIEGMTFQKIADRLGYCHYQIQRLHRKALAMLEG